MENMDEFADLLPDEFDDECLSRNDHLSEKRAARHTQKLDNGIEAQTRILAIPAAKWNTVHEALAAKRLLTPKGIGILNIAMQMPMKIPTENNAPSCWTPSRKRVQKVSISTDGFALYGLSAQGRWAWRGIAKT